MTKKKKKKKGTAWRSSVVVCSLIKGSRIWLSPFLYPYYETVEDVGTDLLNIYSFFLLECLPYFRNSDTQNCIFSLPRGSA